MSNQANSLKKGLTVKDLVTTGIFSAIFFVFTLIGGLPFAPNPVLTFYMPMGAALLCGPIYLLMVAKVQKRWSVTILGIIMGIIWFATGMHWAFSLGYIGMGIIADLVAGAGHYRNKAINLLSYMLISLGGIYTYVVFFIDPEGWASTMLDNGTEQSYIDTMSASAPSWLLAVMLRYIPTIQEDWRFIKDAMRLRDVSPSLKGLLTHPGMTVECIYVPLMMAASKAADELSIASITRGIENPKPRTCLVQIRMGPADVLAILCFGAFFAAGLYGKGVFG